MKNNILIIGAGNIGALFEFEKDRPKPASYVGAFLNYYPENKITLIDSDNKKISKILKRYPEIQTKDSITKDVKNNNYDVIVIATPTDTHLDILKDVLKMDNKVIICEKPLSNNLKTANQMISLLKKRKEHFLVNHQRRFFKSFVDARNKIKKGVLGNIVHANAHYSNGLFNNGSHIIDAVRFLLGDEVESVTGFVNKNNKTNPTFDVNVDAILLFNKGTRMVMQSFDNDIYAIHDIHIYGTKGSLHIKDYGYRFKWRKVKKSSYFKDLKELENKDASKEVQTEGMVKGVVDFCVQILKTKGNKNKVFNLAEDSYINMVVLDSIYESANKGGRLIKIKL